METSTSLLDRLRSCPEEKDWRALDQIYRPLILNWLRSDPTLGDEANDLAQEIMSVVCRELATFQRQRTGSFRKWLRTITAFRVKGYYRARSTREAVVGAVTEGMLVELADDHSELAQRWDQEHNAYVVRRLFEQISQEFSDEHVRAVRRVVLDEAKPAEVAAELGMTVNVVLLAKSRILSRLREVGKGLLD